MFEELRKFLKQESPPRVRDPPNARLNRGSTFVALDEHSRRLLLVERDGAFKLRRSNARVDLFSPCVVEQTRAPARGRDAAREPPSPRCAGDRVALTRDSRWGGPRSISTRSSRVPSPAISPSSSRPRSRGPAGPSL